MDIRQIQDFDIKAVTEIYNHYILHSTVTFEIEPVSEDEMAARVASVLSKYDWLVGEVDGKVIGYAYYTTFKPRKAYERTIESTIYLTQSMKGNGYGSQLYRALFESAVKKGFREVLGVISQPNPESVGFHEKMGFSEVGKLKNVGYKFDKFIDVAFFQKSLHDDI